MLNWTRGSRSCSWKQIRIHLDPVQIRPLAIPSQVICYSNRTHMVLLRITGGNIIKLVDNRWIWVWKVLSVMDWWYKVLSIYHISTRFASYISTHPTTYPLDPPYTPHLLSFDKKLSLLIYIIALCGLDIIRYAIKFVRNQDCM